jgi:hypothetical protein
MGEDNDCYHVEAFRKHRDFRNRLQFYVKWLGYPESDNTWQYASVLQEDMLPHLYQELLSDYRKHSRAQI